MRARLVKPREVVIAGVSLRARLERLLAQAGVEELLVAEHEALPLDEEVLLVRGDVLLDPRIIAALLACRGSIVAVDGRAEGEWVGAARLGPLQLRRWQYRLLIDPIRTMAMLRDQCATLDIATLDDYAPQLRRRVPIYWLEIKTADDVCRAEKILVESSEKDPSDLMAILHRPLENWAVVRLARTPVTPNQLTFLINVLAWAVTVLFATGQLLLGSLLSFAVGLLDGFDGKLARLKGMVTRVGALEHAFDLLFEFSWILALGFYFAQSEGLAPLLLAGVIVTLVAFYRSVYERYGQAAGMSLDVAGRFENFFRRVAGRRNLYNLHILGFILVGRPGWALWSICSHAALTALVYSVQAIRHLWRLDH